MKKPVIIFLNALILSFLFACGPRSGGYPSPQNPGNGSGFDAPSVPEDGTGGMDNHNQQYLTVSPSAQVDKLKNAVTLTDANREFAGPVKKAQVAFDPIEGVSFAIQTEKSDKPYIFSGNLTPVNDRYEGDFEETSGPEVGRKLRVSCAEINCDHADLIFADESHEAGIKATREDRVLHYSVPFDEDTSEVQKEGLEAIPQDTPVEFVATEVFPGKSIVSVRTKTDRPRVLFESEVKTTDSIDGVAASFGIPGLPHDNSITAHYVAGTDNEVVFAISKARKDKPPIDIFFSATKVENKTVTPEPTKPPQYLQVSSQCPIRHLNTSEIHPLVWQIVQRDCGNPVLDSSLSKVKNDSLKNHLELAAHLQDRDTRNSVQRDFNTMMDKLHRKSLPYVWSGVTVKESSFNKNAVGPDHERGVWQLLPSTAFKLFHTNDGERAKALSINVGTATDAAADYYNGFLSQYKNNVEFALAAYNAPGNAQSSFPTHQWTQDFWKICSSTPINNMRNKTCPYVKDIVAVMLISLDPAAYEMNGYLPIEPK